jgi:hypothetical protein
MAKATTHGGDVSIVPLPAALPFFGSGVLALAGVACVGDIGEGFSLEAERRRGAAMGRCGSAVFAVQAMAEISL